MVKRFCPLFLIFLFLLAACAGKPSVLPSSLSAPFVKTAESAKPEEANFFLSTPESGGLVFIGAASKRSNPSETIQLALEDAASRIVMYMQVSGEYAIELNVGSGAFDYTHNTYTSLRFDTNSAAQFVNSLQFDSDKDAIEIDNVLFIRTVYPLSLPVPVNYKPKYSGNNKKPDWVDNPPNEIDGYEVCVGFSGRYSSLADTYKNSRNNAIFGIIRSINAQSRSTDLLYQNSANLFGYKTSNDNMTYSYGTLNSFYVLDTWFDMSNRTVWTLAIAKKL
ncbi:MAG: hypothetical protein LBH16_11500 [Treponema sp.]|jgi:hypothetical protein|nr:hypothetical protein [Treponema sp.]